MKGISAGKHKEYQDEIADILCDAIASSTLPLYQLVRNDPRLPSVECVNTWRRYNKSFQAKFLEAKRLQTHLLIDEIIWLADDPANCEPEILNWSKLRIQTRQFVASKLLYKIYGDPTKNEKSDTVTAIEYLINVVSQQQQSSNKDK